MNEAHASFVAFNFVQNIQYPIVPERGYNNNDNKTYE